MLDGGVQSFFRRMVSMKKPVYIYSCVCLCMTKYCFQAVTVWQNVTTELATRSLFTHWQPTDQGPCQSAAGSNKKKKKRYLGLQLRATSDERLIANKATMAIVTPHKRWAGESVNKCIIRDVWPLFQYCLVTHNSAMAPGSLEYQYHIGTAVLRSIIGKPCYW